MNCWRRLIPLVVVGLLTTSWDGWPVVSAAEMPRKLAFLAGVSKYQKDGLADLAYAEDDVRDLAAELRRHGFEAKEVVGQQATLASLRAELSEFFSELAKLNKDDVAVLAFSGHGLQLQVPREGKLVEEPFFCPVDAQRTNADSLMSLNWVLEQIEQHSGSSQNLLIIDACRNNPAKGAKGVDGSIADRLPNKISILFSSSAGGRSYESDQVRHGVFTHFLLEGIQGGAADRRGRITWLNLASYVMEVVPTRTPELTGDPDTTQRPNLLGNLSGQPVLAMMDTRVANRPPPPNLSKGRPPRPDDDFKNRGRPTKSYPPSFKGRTPQPLRPEEPVEKTEPPPLPAPVNQPQFNLETVVGSLGQVLVKIPAGEFVMGSPETEPGRRDEEPQHRVKIERPFLIGAHEVTQSDFDLVLTGNKQNSSRFPATYLTWYDAMDFCNRLSTREGLPRYYQLAEEQREHESIRSATVTVLGGGGYRLPTKAEWEYACRAGTTTAYSFGDNLDRTKCNVGRDADEVANAAPNRSRAHEVGSYPPNPWGLYDMHGNVSEWCHDLDIVGSARTRVVVSRGGSWFYTANLARSAAFTRRPLSAAAPFDGFRVARDAE